jgi:pimeloyl-ACP methyl ester carboxylesterase
MNPCRNLAAVFIVAAFASRGWALEQKIELGTKTGALHGTLDLPDRSAPFPVALIISGSGPTDRDGNQPLMRNDSLKLLGAALASRGIAALRFDKRGIGESAAAGPREADLRFETYVDDAVQWIEWLRHDRRFSTVAIVGHSEGALIGILAAKKAKVDALVSIAGAARPAPALLREQLAGKLTPSLKERSDWILGELVAGRTVADVPQELLVLYRPSVQPYLISWFKYDPAREIAGLECPLLIVQGTTDIQIPVEDAKRLAASRSGAELGVIDGMNHVLKRATSPAEQQAAYTDPSLPIDPGAVEKVVTFLTAQRADAH